MESAELDRMINNLVDVITSTNRHNWKEVWNQIQAIGQSFKGVRFPQPDERNAAWARFQGIVERIKTEQNSERARNEEAKREIDERLAHLERDAAGAEAGVVSWGQVWGEIKSIRESFKQVRLPSKADRETAWQRLHAVADRATAQRGKREIFERQSNGTKYRIMGHAEAARPLSGIESLGLIFLAPILVIESLIDTVFELITGEKFDQAKEQLQGMS